MITDIDRHLFNIDLPSASPAKGSLLVAEPFLREEYFRHSVITLIDHANDSGAMGVVMNRRISTTLQSVIDGVKIKQPIPIYCGGPMSTDRLYFLHTLGNIIPGANLITDGLYVSGDFDAVIDYVNQGYPLDGYLRFFLGYSGWTRGQLEEEVTNNVWAVIPSALPSRLLTGCEDPYWHRYVRELGSTHKGWLMHPGNPHAN